MLTNDSAPYPHLVAAVQTAVESTLASFRRGRAHKTRLVADVLAVATGLRAAFMFDYLPTLPASSAARLCAPLSAAFDRRLVILSWQGCLWLVNLDRFVQRCATELHSGSGPDRAAAGGAADCGVAAPANAATQTPAGAAARPARRIQLVEFVEGGDGELLPRLRPLLDSKAALQELRRLEALAQQQLKRHLDAADCAVLDEDMGGRSAAARDVWTLADSEAVGALPLFNGFLLGYPIVYAITHANVNRACRHLSTSSLWLFRLYVDSSAGVGSESASKRCETDRLALFSYSVPTSCLSPDQADALVVSESSFWPSEVLMWWSSSCYVHEMVTMQAVVL